MSQIVLLDVAQLRLRCPIRDKPNGYLRIAALVTKPGEICRLDIISFRHRLPGSASEPAKQLAVMEEVGSQHLRDDEDPLRVTDLFEHLLGQQRRSRCPALGSTRRAQLSSVLLSVVRGSDVWTIDPEVGKGMSLTSPFIEGLLWRLTS